MKQPFSNGTEALAWLETNCHSCRRACLWHQSKDNINFKRAVEDGRECRLKYDIDIGFISGEIPDSTYMEIKGDGNFSQCSKYKPRESDQGEEGVNALPEDPNQLKLF